MKPSPLKLVALHSHGGFASAKVLIVVLTIIGGTGLLAYEWHHAHAPAKQHHTDVVQQHHHHKHGGKGVAKAEH